MRLGIVGLPNVGKSTLFNAITKAGAESANYPFCTIEPNVGVVSVPDRRLDVLEKMYNTKRKVYTTVEFYDIAGLVKGASKGEGLGNKFLSHIREVEAIVHTVRCFNDENVVHVEGSVDPIRDIETINLELNKPIRTLEVNEDEEAFIKTLFMITSKPVLYACNISEDDMMSGNLNNEYVQKVREYAEAENSEIVVVCAKLEEELSGLEDEEKAEMLEEYGLTEAGLDKLIRASYRLLGLISYLTAGVQEVRAWTIKEGTKAPQAAGKIHTDIERGFIRAEVVAYNDLVECGSEAQAKEKGKYRLEGKDYVMHDGDVVNFRFNV